VAAYWTRMLEIMASKRGQVKHFFPAAAMLLFYIIQRITFPKILYFLKIYSLASLNEPIANGAIVDTSSQVLSRAMFVLSIAGN
jgi:hypothetical protein